MRSRTSAHGSRAARPIGRRLPRARPEQVQDGCDAGEQQDARGEDRSRDVDRQPVRPQRGHHGRGLACRAPCRPRNSRTRPAAARTRRGGALGHRSSTISHATTATRQIAAVNSYMLPRARRPSGEPAHTSIAQVQAESEDGQRHALRPIRSARERGGLRGRSGEAPCRARRPRRGAPTGDPCLLGLAGAPRSLLDACRTARDVDAEGGLEQQVADLAERCVNDRSSRSSPSASADGYLLSVRRPLVTAVRICSFSAAAASRRTPRRSLRGRCGQGRRPRPPYAPVVAAGRGRRAPRPGAAHGQREGQAPSSADRGDQHGSLSRVVRHLQRDPVRSHRRSAIVVPSSSVISPPSAGSPAPARTSRPCSTMPWSIAKIDWPRPASTPRSPRYTSTATPGCSAAGYPEVSDPAVQDGVGANSPVIASWVLRRWPRRSPPAGRSWSRPARAAHLVGGRHWTSPVRCWPSGNVTVKRGAYPWPSR